MQTTSVHNPSTATSTATPTHTRTQKPPTSTRAMHHRTYSVLNTPASPNRLPQTPPCFPPLALDRERVDSYGRVHNTEEDEELFCILNSQNVKRRLRKARQAAAREALRNGQPNSASTITTRYSHYSRSRRAQSHVSEHRTGILYTPPPTLGDVCIAIADFSCTIVMAAVHATENFFHHKSRASRRHEDGTPMQEVSHAH